MTESSIFSVQKVTLYEVYATELCSSRKSLNIIAIINLETKLNGC